MSKVPTGGGPWLKGTDIKPGDTCVIKDEANWVTGEYKGTETNQYCATVEYEGEDRMLKFTKISRKNLVVLGADSNDWIGKTISLKAVDILVDDKMHKTIVCEPVIPAAAPTTQATQPQFDADGNEIAWDE